MDIIAVVVSLIILSVASIILNAICLYIFRKSSQLQNNPSSQLVANLLSVGLFQGLVVIPLYSARILRINDRSWSQLIVNSFAFFYMLSFYGTNLSVFSISVDRVLAIYLLNRYTTIVTLHRTRRFLLILWIYIIALCLVPFIDFHKTQETFNQSKTFNVTNITIGASMFYIYYPKKEWGVPMLIINGALPFTIIVFNYLYIILKLKKIELVDLKGKVFTVKGTPRAKYKEVTCITFVISLTYFVLWVPSIVYFTCSMCKSCRLQTRDYHIVRCFMYYLSFLNTMATPIIYCIYDSEFKRYFLDLLRIFRWVKCKSTKRRRTYKFDREFKENSLTIMNINFSQSSEI